MVARQEDAVQPRRNKSGAHGPPMRVLQVAAAWVVWPVLLAFVLEAVKYSYHPDPDGWMYDMRSYITGARAILNGTDPYTTPSEFGEFYIYPPFALLLFLPLARLSWQSIALIATAVSIAALQASIYLALRQVGIKHRVWLTVAILLPCFLWYPVDQTLYQGQVNLLLLALVLLDLNLPNSSRFKGVLIGICAGIKFVPGVLIVCYLAARQFHAALRVVLTAAGTVVLGFVLFPQAASNYWTTYIFDTTRVAQQASWLPNESLRGMLARTLHSEEAAILPWVVSSIVVLSVAVATTWYATKLGQGTLGIAAMALAGLLIIPVAWHHHWVWIIPITIYLARTAYLTRSTLLWVCAVVPPIIIALRLNERFVTDPYHLDSLAIYGFPLITTSIVTYMSILMLLGLLVYVVAFQRRRTPSRSIRRT